MYSGDATQQLDVIIAALLGKIISLRQEKPAKSKDSSGLTYLLGDATLQAGGEQWVWN